jgi:DNA-binding MarR family transcriptional regulator
MPPASAQRGLVQRSLCDLDRRGIYVCLTEAGRRRYAEALPTQRAVLAAMLDRGRRRGPAA